MMRWFLTCLSGLVLAGSVAFAQDAENVLVIDVAGTANGTIEIELLPDVAPLHVERIKLLAREGAYDKILFHRVIDGFMAQTGDVEFGQAEGDLAMAGRGGSSYPDLPSEFSEIAFDKGIVGMARSQDPNSANSQFFIMLDAGHFLNGQYTVFGRVLSGQETVDMIERGDPRSGAVEDPDVMISVRVKADIPG